MRNLSSSILAVLLIAGVWLPAFSQSGKPKGGPAAKDEIQWQASRKLVWADFKGRAGSHEDKHALTTSDIAINVSCDGHKFEYQVRAVFVPSESWTRSTDSDALLAHEQLHFDITELHARKMRLMFSMLPKPCLLDNKKIQELVNQSFAAWHQMEDDYDHATNHGLNEKAQQEWKRAIGLALQELEKVQ